MGGAEREDDESDTHGVVVSCHVSYLQRPTDEDETMITNVTPSRMRLVLGSDPTIPSTYT